MQVSVLEGRDVDFLGFVAINGNAVNQRAVASKFPGSRHSRRVVYDTK